MDIVAPRHPAIPTAATVCALLLALPAPPPLTAQDGGAARTESAPADAVDPALFQELEYRMVGPSRGGRVTTVAGHPSHPFTFYMGTVGGGVWRTTDAGRSWRPLTDGQIRTSSAMGAVRVAPSDPDVIYAGTGSDGIRSNVIAGRGIYRSTDGGATWDFLGLENTGQIGAVEVHPENPELAYVAALGSPFGPNPERGVYRTRNGGESWERVLFTSDSVGARDVELAPDDPNTLYASLWRGERKPWTIISGMEASAEEDGIWRSTDGGDTWEIVREGLPTGLIGKIDLAVTPADPDRVYAVVEAPDPHEGLYRSDDRGMRWRLVSNQAGLMNRPFYYTNVDADPTDADVVWVNNERLFRSVDGGRSWEIVRTPHGDNHDMWINPDDTDIMVQSNDGGANVSLDGGRSWSGQHNQPTAELYQVDVDDRFPYFLYAGQQDNSTIAVPSLPPAEPAPSGPSSWWKSIGGCETGPVVPKPGDPSIVYANCKGRFGRFSFETGQEKQYYVGAVDMYGVNPQVLPYRFQRTVPIEVSPHDPDVVYHGSQYVHRTSDDGVTWERISPDLTANPPERQVVSGGPITRDITGEEHYSTLYVIEESPHEPGVIWAGANDGPVHVTRNGGESWTDVTPPDMPPEGRINAIEISHHRPSKVYVAGYRWLLNDFAPYVWRTTDYGESWERLTPGDNGIPGDHPVRVVREDPDREGLLYAGTEFGMFVSFDDGANWQPFQQNLPRTPITDLEVHEGDLLVSTMGRSFWILDDLSPLHRLDEVASSSELHLFQPRPAYRMRYSGGGGFGGREPWEPEYPQPGAFIDYRVPSGMAGGELILEFLDATGKVIRSYSSRGAGERRGEDQGMRGTFGTRSGDPVLDASAGMHRFRWDMRHPGPWREGTGGFTRSGPLVAPGSYRVRLSRAGDGVESAQLRELEILVDPRVEADGVTLADLREQESLTLSVRDGLSEARRTLRRIEETRENLRDRGVDPEDPRMERLLGLERTLVPDPSISSYAPRRAIDQWEYLYGMLTDADQKPGVDAHERYRQLRSELDGILDDVERIAGQAAEE